MSEETVHIEVYLRKNNNTNVSYEIEDNDASILFSTFILDDCLHQFGTEEKEILFISSDELKERYKFMKKKIPVIPSNIEYKINCLMGYIKKTKTVITLLEQFILCKKKMKLKLPANNKKII